MSDQIGCVVIPTYDLYLTKLAERQSLFTALIWPGFGGKARPMIGPYDWFTAGPRREGQRRQPPQVAIPFLFRSIGKDGSKPPFKISHVGLTVYMAHDHIVATNPAILAAMDHLRVEVFAGTLWGNDYVRTWYVVSNTIALDPIIPYEGLTLISQERPLDPSFTRGYGMVWLPAQLRDWFEVSVQQHTDLLTMQNGERWQCFS